MSYAVPKAEAPHLNKAARKRLWREQEMKRRFAPEVERDGYEAFYDPHYFDLWCVRPSGSRHYDNTVHVVHRSEIDVVIDWLAGKREDIPFKLLHDERDRSLLARWRAGLLSLDQTEGNA